MPKAKSWRVIGRRREAPGTTFPRLRQPARAPLARTAEEFIDQHQLHGLVAGARDLATRHFGERFTGLACHLYAEGADLYVEVEVGINVPLKDFLRTRSAYLDLFEAAYPDVDWDQFHLSVRLRESAD
jgi:hypothetical protein